MLLAWGYFFTRLNLHEFHQTTVSSDNMLFYHFSARLPFKVLSSKAAENAAGVQRKRKCSGPADGPKKASKTPRSEEKNRVKSRQDSENDADVPAEEKPQTPKRGGILDKFVRVTPKGKKEDDSTSEVVDLTDDVSDDQVKEKEEVPMKGKEEKDEGENEDESETAMIVEESPSDQTVEEPSLKDQKESDNEEEKKTPDERADYLPEKEKESSKDEDAAKLVDKKEESKDEDDLSDEKKDEKQKESLAVPMDIADTLKSPQSTKPKTAKVRIYST